jgi:hypothetical protein
MRRWFWVVVACQVACGGAIAKSQEAGEPKDASTGPTDASPAQTEGGIADAGLDSGGFVPGTCAAACANFDQLPCATPGCEAGCADALSAATSKGCGGEFEAFLECESQPGSMSCGQGTVTGCTAQGDAVATCEDPPPPPPPGCEGIPNPSPSLLRCAGAGDPSDFTGSCSDRYGNTWTTTCQGSTCSCEYNGQTACTCAYTVGSPCCPGSHEGL